MLNIWGNTKVMNSRHHLHVRCFFLINISIDIVRGAKTSILNPASFPRMETVHKSIYILFHSTHETRLCVIVLSSNANNNCFFVSLTFDFNLP